MSYYRAGGDYYRGGRGDLFGTIGSIAKKALGIFGGPVGSVISNALPGTKTASIPMSIPPVIKAPFSTGVKIGTDITHDLFGGGSMPRRHRRMNAGNAKALKRAIRREDAFLNLAKGALHGRYTISPTHRAPRAKKKR